VACGVAWSFCQGREHPLELDVGSIFFLEPRFESSKAIGDFNHTANFTEKSVGLKTNLNLIGVKNMKEQICVS
jgi:hypothetical protein